MLPDGAAVHRSDEASPRVGAAAALARANFTDTHSRTDAVLSRLIIVEGRPLGSELGLVGEVRPQLLQGHVRVSDLAGITVPHETVVLVVAAIAGLAPDLGAGAAAAGVSTSVISLVDDVVLLRLEESWPELRWPLLGVVRLLLRRFEVLLLVLIVILLPVGRDNALQLLWVVMVHADVVDRRLVLLVYVLNMDWVLHAAASNL